MELSQITPTPTQIATPGTAVQTPDGITSDFETFLKMLTVQMQNQDPLNPVDSTDYATQLATFSQVEQAVLTNDLLKSLSSQLTSSGLADMAAWVGKEARAATPAYFDGAPIMLSPNPAVVADTAEVIVRDADGVEVQRFGVPISAEPVEWAGVGADGAPMQEGFYSFEVVSFSNGEVLASDPVEVYSIVTEVRAQDGQTILILEGGAAIPSSEITALRDAA